MRINLMPISINKAYRGGRRFKSKDYLNFEKQMLEMIPDNHQKFSGNYAIHLKFYMKNALACDLSNFIKTTEDIIVKSGIVKDDRFCWHMTVEKFKSDENYLEFEIEDMEDTEEIMKHISSGVMYP